MLQLARQIAAASEVITRTWSHRPRVGIILGTGLGNFVEQINDDLTISYSEIPHFPRSTAIGHKGLLVCGRLGLWVLTFKPNGVTFCHCRERKNMMV